MATVAQLAVKVSADTQNAEQGLRRVGNEVDNTAQKGGVLQSAFGGINNVLGSVTKVALGFVGGLSAVAGGLAALGISANASMEQTATAFTTLLGSGEAAMSFLDELRTFAAATPFEFPELADASRKLLAFGFAAKDIIPMMTSIGDAVGALGGGQAEINRVTLALGQMQAKGKVSAEEMMQLAELGIPAWKMLADSMGLSTAEVMKLSERGLIPASQAIPALLTGMEQTFGGSMQAQAQTFNGLLSTLKDNAGLALQAFAGPMFDQAKQALSALGTAVADPRFQAFAAQVGSWVGSIIAPLINGFISLINSIMNAGSASQFFIDALNNIVPGLGNIVSVVFSYGAALVQSFASGIASAFSYVVGVLQEIGGIISYWLAPGSPPRIVPNLDQYGADAASVYFDGWSQGDYSALQDIGQTIQDVLGGLVDTGLFAEQDVIPRVLGTQGALQDAINQLRETGQVSQELIDNIVNGAGPAGDTIRGFVSAYFDLESATRAVKDAQDELNRVQDEYNSKLEPLNADLKAIQDRKKALQDQQRIEQLNKKIADGKLTDTEKAIALAEIEEIQKRQQIDAVQKEKDAAVDAAQQKVDAAKKTEDAAKANLDAQKASIALFNKQNQLMGQQAQLLERIAKADAPKGGAGGGGIGKPKIGGGLGGLPKPGELGGPITEAIKPLSDLATGIDNAKQRFIDFKQSVVESMDTVQQKAAPALSIFNGGLSQLSGLITPIKGMLDTLTSTISNVASQLQQGNISGAITAAIGGSGDMTEKAIELARNIIMGIAQGISDNMPTIAAKAGELITTLATATTDALPGIVQALAGWGVAFGDWAINDGIPALLRGLGSLIATMLGWIIENGPGILSNLATWGGMFLAWVVETIPKLIAKLGELFGELLLWIIQKAPEIGPKLVEWGNMFANWITETAIPGITTKLGELWTKLTGWISEKATAIAADDSIGTAIVDGIKKGITNAWEGLKSFANQKATELLNSAKAALGISSPSEEFRKQIGVNIVLGIIEGINNKSNAAVNTVKELSSKILKAAFDAQAAFMRSKAGAIAGLQDIIPDSDKLKNINERIGMLQKKIDKGDKSGGTQKRMLLALQLQAELLAAVTHAQDELNKAELESNDLRKIDADLANEYYDMRTSQILEIAKLEKEKQEAKTQADKDRIQQQITLLKAAQDAELKAFQEHIKEVKDQLQTQIQETIKDIADRVNGFMRDSLSGIAGLARGRASARRAIADMLPDPSKLTDLKNQLKDLADEEALQRINATNTNDLDAAKAAQERLLEIAKERADIEKQLADEQRAQTLQGDIAKRAQEQLAQAEKEALELRKTDPKLADEYYDLKSKQILELAQLEQDKANAKSDAERRAIDEQIALVKEAQQAELKLFEDDAKKRADEINDLNSDMQSAATQFGDTLIAAIRQAIEEMRSGLTSIPATLPADARVLANDTTRLATLRAGATPDRAGTVINNHYTIDARGSTLTEAQIRKIIQDQQAQSARTASVLSRTR